MICLLCSLCQYIFFGKKTKSLTVFRRCRLNILSSNCPSSILKYTSYYLAFLFLTFLLSMAQVLVWLCQDIGCGGDYVDLHFSPPYFLSKFSADHDLVARYCPICLISLEISLIFPVRHVRIVLTIFVAMKMNLAMNSAQTGFLSQTLDRGWCNCISYSIICIEFVFGLRVAYLPKASGLDILTRGYILCIL